VKVLGGELSDYCKSEAALAWGGTSYSLPFLVHFFTCTFLHGLEM
jgi:hypothetical protein